MKKPAPKTQRNIPQTKYPPPPIKFSSTQFPRNRTRAFSGNCPHTAATNYISGGGVALIANAPQCSPRSLVAARIFRFTERNCYTRTHAFAPRNVLGGGTLSGDIEKFAHFAYLVRRERARAPLALAQWWCEWSGSRVGRSTSRYGRATTTTFPDDPTSRRASSVDAESMNAAEQESVRSRRRIVVIFFSEFQGKSKYVYYFRIYG